MPPLDTYPNQVRSDVKDYLNNFGKGIILGRSQLDYFQTIKKNHHFQFSFGVFEEMFSGYGFEYLWKDTNYPFAIGFEVFDAYKRDYSLDLKLQDYSNVTGHINMYYENSQIIPFSLHLSFGEYLAGDRGMTFDISRRFKNGVSMGAFITRTNVPIEKFGEGSFDRGLYFEIPLNNEWFKYFWRPLQKIWG